MHTYMYMYCTCTVRSIRQVLVHCISWVQYIVASFYTKYVLYICSIITAVRILSLPNSRFNLLHVQCTCTCIYLSPQHLMQLRLLVQQEFQGRQHLLSLRRTPSTEESVNISSPTATTTAPVVHFVETAPSVLREMPWIQLKEHKVHVHILYVIAGTLGSYV